MKATNWEFRNRASIFGLIFGCSFPLYMVDSRNAGIWLANLLGPRIGIDSELLAHLLFALGALAAALAALIRTWASSYLNAGVVYAAEVKTASLVADGPYRRVRNPLYFANVLLASRLGFVFMLAAMVLFCYRLILREEADLAATQGAGYERYRQAVPRLWPAVTQRVPSSGQSPQWKVGFKSEFWCWGFATSIAVFAITLSLVVILGASLALFWLTSSMLSKTPDSPVSG